MEETQQRAAVVAEARSWLGTPYHHEGDLKGVGVDCGMLLVRVFVDAGIVAPFDPRPYERDWHLHRVEEKYLGFLLQRGGEIAGPPAASPRFWESGAPGAPEPGDIVMWRYGRTFSHGAIVSAWPLVIHAFANEGLVVESDLSKPGLLSDPARPVKFFSVWRR